MIYGNKNQIEEFAFLDEKVKTCFEYIASHDLYAMQPGRYEIDGDRIFLNLEEFETIPAEGRDFEAHKRYLDLFYIVDGAEQVDVSFIQKLRNNGYEEARDRMSLDGDAACSLVLSEGDFLICYPHDGHRPAICVGEPAQIKKAVFKIQIEAAKEQS